MKKLSVLITTTLLLLAFSAVLFTQQSAAAATDVLVDGKVVVANRNSGSISILDAGDGDLIATIPLPQAQGENLPEPMYVVYTRTGDQFFVGDRANDRVVAFDADTFSLLGTIPTGQGVFHMWADPRGRQLWVNNDIDNTSTVFNPATYEVLATVASPPDLVAMGGKPHDVILDPQGNFAYVTVLGLSGESDYVVQYSTETFEEVGRAAVGKDPHVSLTQRNGLLYVPSQGSNAVYVLDRLTMELVDILDIPGAHGAGMAFSGKYFYTSNLPGGGSEALYIIDTNTGTILGEPTDAPYAVPHNIVLTTEMDMLFLTHSGPTSDKVTFYSVGASDPTPILVGEATVGFNPFGLAFVP